MPRSPMTVRGIRSVLDALGDEVAQAAKRGRRLGPGTELEASGAVKLRGIFGFDRTGKFGFKGRALTSIPIDGVAAEVGADTELGWESEGDGTLEVDFSIKVMMPGNRTKGDA